MNNKLILDLTVRLTQALDQNYDVVNMDTVLAVISALEGATITKEQLETTRLAKHINQLRRRNKSNIIAIRAKNLLKKWREMVGITSQVQSEGASSSTQQALPTQQQVSKPPLSSTSQPTSPYTAQLLGENFDNSLSSIGGGIEFSRTATGGVSNTGSANFTFNKKSAIGTAGEGGGIISSRSNGALTDTQMRLMKSSNRSITNNNSPSLPATVTKVKHPTSFKNLITGFNVNNVPKQTNPSALSPILKVSPASGGGGEEREENNLKTNSTAYIIDDDDNQSQPSTTRVTQTGVSSPRTHKSMKRKERDSPVVMAFIQNSNSPLGFENTSHQPGQSSETTRNNNANQIVTSTIDLHDSNSSSTSTSALCEVTEINIGNSTCVGTASNSNKRIRKDKKRSNERVELVTESEHFQPTIDESSRIAFPISGIQEYLSLSNSSMSIFPSQKTAGSGGTETYPPNIGSNEDNQPLVSSTVRSSEVVDGDLTFTGKFKQSNCSSGIEVGSSSNYFSNGGENMSVTSSDFPCGNMKVAINNCRDSVSVGGTASTSTFLQFSRNSNDSTSNSRTSQLDLIDVVNQDSQSMITVDDLRQQQKSSNEKDKTQRDVENVQDTQQAKCVKDNSNTAKQYSKDQVKSVPIQKPINVSSKPSTPTAVPSANIASAVTSPPAEQKIPKKRGRKKGSKGVDSVLAQSAGLSSQFLMGAALGPNKKVKTTMELLADIQNRKLGSATSSPTLMNWFGTSRPPSSCSEPSLHSPRTSDACSTNATMSTAPRSTPEKNISNNSVAADELYESDSDSNTSEPSHDSVKMSAPNSLLNNSQSKPITSEGNAGTEVSVSTSTIEEQIKELMALLPPVDMEKIDWESYEDVPCTCTLTEVPPEVKVEVASTDINENGLNLLENMEDINNKENDGRQDDDEPVISVSVLPLAPQNPHQTKPWSPMAPHSQSAPVSAVTSPVVPSTNQKPMKSIFDLDFDDDYDPLHSFVEAASKTKKTTENSLTTENGRIMNNEKSKILTNTQCNDHSDVVKAQQTQQAEPQSELTQQPSSVEAPPEQIPPPHIGITDTLMPIYANFPTYEVIEDADCQAKQRYEIQTNQITKFHINAFHNCFIPNVNGNWDHSVPQIDDEILKLENDNLPANVVPKYGCFVHERIPKDLSHVKFTKDFKPKITKKSDKPLQPFLGVANIHRRQHFRLHHHRKPKKNATLKKKKKSKIVVKIEIEQETKTENADPEVCSVPDPLDATASSNIPESTVAIPSDMKVDMDIKCMSDEKETETSQTGTPEISSASGHSTKLHDKDELYQEQCTAIHKNNTNNLIIPSITGDSESTIHRNNGGLDDLSKEFKTEPTDLKKPKANGSIHHLVNNNSIVHCSDESKSEIAGSKKPIHNNNHNLLIDGMDGDGIAASRRSSSCSNTSLKQNQNSINMKLRRHRLEQQQLEKQRQRRKRKHLSSLTDVFEFDTDEPAEQSKVRPLLKRIKIVNGKYTSERRLTNSITDSSCLDDDGDSDCYHVHSETDIITDEEIDEDCDDHIIREGDDDFEFGEIPDDYDEEDGDDEEDVEEDYGDFHEVVTRDMTSSTTGNNHIVLTIKKTPSKTNSPSSSSMSPAPVLSVNAKLSSISPTIQSTVDALLLEDNAIELTTDQIESDYKENSKIELGKLLELSTVNAVELIGKTNFFLPESSDVAIYSFQLKKNGDNDHVDNDGNENERRDENEMPDENEIPNENEIPDENEILIGNERSDANETGDATGGAEAINGTDEPTKPDKKENEQNVPFVANRKEFKEITKAELSESLQLTKKHLRRIELKTRLREGIEEAQKLHRQLFFPYELHPSIGSKILEISSCTSDCTDPSDDETDSSDSDTTSTSSSSGVDGMKSRIMLKRRGRRTNLPPKKKRAVGGGGGPPSSSSSSSSSDSSSSSGSYTSWTTTSSSSDDENSRAVVPAVKKEENKEEQSTSSDNKDKEDQKELPNDNNYLLRSFNHIYISTEERLRQQQLAQTGEYRHIINAGYITLSGNASREDTPSTSTAPFVSSYNNGAYVNYYNNNNPNLNIYSRTVSRSGITSSYRLPTYNMNIATPSVEPATVEASTIDSLGVEPSIIESTTVESSAVESPTVESSAVESSIVEPSIVESSRVEPPALETLVEETSTVEISSIVEPSTAEPSTVILPTFQPSIGETINNDSNYRINPENSFGSNNNNSSVQLDENVEQDLVAQEEYRTGMRKVDEDVDDEDGNNCARTQQFKEWHEVLQLRSYNDELLTVLPYVVIE